MRILKAAAAALALLCIAAPALAADIKPLVNAAGQIRPVHAGETVGVPSGGTGAVALTSHGVVIGGGAGPVAVTATGSSGQVLTSNGASADPTWQPATGGVTSVTCGTGLSGGTITSTGTCALATNGGALSHLVQIAGNRVLGNATGSTANVAELALPSCSAAASALTWTTASGFGCNTITAGGVSPSTPTLTVTAITKPTTLNATTVGTRDYFFPSGTNIGPQSTGFGQFRKLLGGSIIQMEYVLPINTFNQAPDTLTVTSTDATSGAASTGTRAGIFQVGSAVGHGIVIQAPADTTSRTIRIYGSTFSSLATLTAHLTDGSIADVVMTPAGNTSAVLTDLAYEITYSASRDGQKLVLQWLVTTNGGSGNLCIMGAVLF